MNVQTIENEGVAVRSNDAEGYDFGVFELDARTLELWRRARRCRLAPQPARVLVYLVRHAGVLVTRDELAQAVWEDGTHVDAEAGLNAAIRQVRQALGDDAVSPRFIETLPRRGYRFIAPVTRKALAAPMPDSPAAGSLVAGIGPDHPSAYVSAQRGWSRHARRAAIGAVVLLIFLASAVLLRREWAAKLQTPNASTQAPSTQASPAESPALAIAPAALDAYFKGRYILRSGSEQSGVRAAAQFTRALEIDPGAVPALAGLASARLRMTVEGDLVPEAGLAMAFDEADRALAADPRLAEGWRARARARWLGRWDWKGADADYAQALVTAPQTANTHIAYAFFRSAAGDHDGAVALLEEASRLDPLSPAVNLDSAWLFFFARRYEEAITRAERALELDPTLFSAHYCLAASYGRLDRHTEASRHAQAMTASVGGPRPGQRSNDSDIAPSGGDRDAMLHWWQQQAEGDTRTFPHYDRALFALSQGKVGVAIAAFEASIERREIQVTRLAVDPRLEILATDPRFQSLVARIGGPDPLELFPSLPILERVNEPGD